MELRWQPHVLSLLADMRGDHRLRPVLHRLADTLAELETELDLASGDGNMWIVPIPRTDWVIVCSNDEPDVLVVRYLGRGFS